MRIVFNIIVYYIMYICKYHDGCKEALITFRELTLWNFLMESVHIFQFVGITFIVIGNIQKLIQDASNGLVIST